MISNVSVSLKLKAIVVAAVVALIVAVWLALSALHGVMVKDRVAKVRNLAEVARGIVTDGYAEVQKGTLSDAEARKRVADRLRGLRYEKNDYIFVYAADGTGIVMPGTPDREGGNFLDIKDSDGQPFIRQMIDQARGAHEPVFYSFPRVGSSTPEPKVAASTFFEPWGWMIGTGVYIDDIEQEFRAVALRLGGLVLLVAVVGGGAVSLLANHISRPLVRLAGVTQRLSQRDYDVEVGEGDRADEIGALAQAIRVLRDEAREAARLRDAREETERQAEIDRRATAERTADAFEGSVKQVAHVIEDASQQLHGAAGSMAQLADEASSRAIAIAGAAEEASTNVQTVASAADQLSASIAEISRQVQNSTAVSSRAVSQAERTDTLVQGLANTSTRIGEIIVLINDIASQTNLLALNATIEAARAGDAGKGFAVVAGEVKTLASQTARATEEIGGQIAAVQTATAEAVQAVRAIGETIRGMNEITATIAAAVEEQSSATSEISRNIEQASHGTRDITENLNLLTTATAQVGQTSGEVLRSAGRLSEQVHLLDEEADSFLSAVRSR